MFTIRLCQNYMCFLYDVFVRKRHSIIVNGYWYATHVLVQPTTSLVEFHVKHKIHNLKKIFIFVYRRCKKKNISHKLASKDLVRTNRFSIKWKILTIKKNMTIKTAYVCGCECVTMCLCVCNYVALN